MRALSTPSLMNSPIHNEIETQISTMKSNQLSTQHLHLSFFPTCPFSPSDYNPRISSHLQHFLHHHLCVLGAPLLTTDPYDRSLYIPPIYRGFTASTLKPRYTCRFRSAESTTTSSHF